MAQVSYLRRPVGIAREQLRELLPLQLAVDAIMQFQPRQLSAAHVH